MKHILILILFFSISLVTFSQTQTEYEKKCYSLTIELLKKLGVNESLFKQNKDMNDLQKLLITESFMKKINTEQGLIALMEYKHSIEEAEKLKTKIDFQKAKEKEEKEKYNKSDFIQIKNSIRNEFEKWMQKGEFEKTEDYQQRLKNSAKKFDTICFNNIFNLYTNKKYNLTSKLLHYNADTEKFGIEFNLNGQVLTDSIGVPIDEATKFKSQESLFKLNVDYADWKFINNNLYPSSILYYNSSKDSKESFQIVFKKEIFKSISITSNELNLPQTLLNTRFDYDDFCENLMFNTKDLSTINSLGWKFLLGKDFAKALQIFEKSQSILDVNSKFYSFFLGNLAHAYLFTNQIEKARNIYLNNINRKVGQNSWKDAVLQDFSLFKSMGIYSPEMDRILIELSKSNTKNDIWNSVVNGVSEQNSQNNDINHNQTQTSSNGDTIPATFPGGANNLQKYIERNLNRDIPVEKKARPGKYKVCVSFTVNPSGLVVDVVADNNPGYGMAEEAVRVFQKSPQWKPASLGGRNIGSLHHACISFIISKE